MTDDTPTPTAGVRESQTARPWICDDCGDAKRSAAVLCGDCRGSKAHRLGEWEHE